ncbi:MAG: hypothetical protein JWN48_2608 [Myxococcaceae bacterium]|nr:hypothetical protein [Myxococcaceae bacterium]
MHFELDLAIAYGCALALFGWVVSWLVPALLGAMVSSLASVIRSLRQRHPASGSMRGNPRTVPTDWWGPTHHSQ